MQTLRAFLLIFRKSLTNLDYYRELKDVRWRFAGKYFFALIFLTTLISIVPIIWRLQTTRIPNIKIVVQKGQLSTNLTEPYLFPNPAGGKALVAFGDYSGYQEKAFFSATKDALVSPTESVPWHELQDDISLNMNSLWWALGSLMILINFLIIPFVILEKLISLALLSLIFRSVLRKKFLFNQIFKIGLFASTLPIVFFAILGLFNLTPAIPLGYTLTLALFVGIIFHHLWKKNS